MECSFNADILRDPELTVSKSNFWTVNCIKEAVLQNRGITYFLSITKAVPVTNVHVECLVPAIRKTNLFSLNNFHEQGKWKSLRWFP